MRLDLTQSKLDYIATMVTRLRAAFYDCSTNVPVLMLSCASCEESFLFFCFAELVASNVCGRDSYSMDEQYGKCCDILSAELSLFLKIRLPYCK